MDVEINLAEICRSLVVDISHIYEGMPSSYMSRQNPRRCSV